MKSRLKSFYDFYLHFERRKNDDIYDYDDFSRKRKSANIQFYLPYIFPTISHFPAISMFRGEANIWCEFAKKL